MKEMYDSNEYADKNPTWHEEDAPWKARQVATMVKNSRIAGKSIAEIGCGTGGILLNLESLLPESTFSGYEIAPQAFARAKLRETNRTKFYLEDLLKDQEKYFDLLLIMDVIEHVEDCISFIKSLKSVAKHKIFHIPLDLSAQSIVRSWPIMKLRNDVGHIHYFYKESALATLKDCGYNIISYNYTASRLELPNQVLSSRLMRIPRRLMFSFNEDLTARILGGYSLLVLAE